MSTPNVFISLNFPFSGTGAASDVSGLSAEKTFVVQGPFTNSVIIEGSQDGVSFVPLTQIALPVGQSSEISISAVVSHIRLRRLGSGPPGTVTVGGTVAQSNSFSALTLLVPGPGPAIDVSTFGTIKTFVATGPYSGLVVIEGSQDGVSFNAITGLGTGQFVTINGSYKNIRTRTAGFSGSASVTMGAAEENSGSGDVVADWDINKVRYYAVNPQNNTNCTVGNDANVGYIDDVPGKVFASGAFNSIALKTWEELFLRFPPLGQRHRAVILVGSGTLLKKDGVTIDDIRRDGWQGYEPLVIRASNFLNDANDKVDLAGQIAVAGPNGDLSWTLSSLVGFVATVAAGAIPIADASFGNKLRWKGNTTAAMRALGGMVRDVSAGGVSFNIAAKIAAFLPVLNDEFFIEKPSVIVGGLVGNVGNNSRYALPSPNPQFTGTRGIQIAGFQFTVPVGSWSAALADNDVLQFCEVPSGATLNFLGAVASSSSYLDESLLAVVALHMLRCPGGNLTLAWPLSSQNGNVNNVCALGGLNVNPGPRNASFFMAGSFVRSSFTATGFGGGNRIATQGGSPSLLGNAGSAFTNTLKVAGSPLPGITAGSTLLACDCTVNGAEFNSNNGGASGLNLETGRYDLENLTGTNPDAGVHVIGPGCVVVVGPGNTIAGGGATDVRVGGNTFTWAQAAAEGFADLAGNVLIAGSTLGGPIIKLSLGTILRAQILGADPAVVADGDVWITSIAGVKNICVRVAGATVRALLA